MGYIRKNLKKKPGAPKKSVAAASQNMLHRLAFDNSLQANIVSTVNGGKIILANKSACKLLGYSKKELLTKSRADIVDINDNRFKKMLEQRKTRGKATALVTVIKKSGKRIPCEITSAVFMGENGIEVAIITITDISQNILRQKSIDTKQEKIVANNIVRAKSKQRNIDTKKERIVADNIVRAKSKQKNIDSKKEKIIARNIILAKAKSNREKLDNETAIRKQFVTEYEERFKLIFNSSSDVLYDSDLITGEVIISDAYEKEFGYKITGHMRPEEDWISHIHPDDKEAVVNDYLRAVASEDIEWKYSYRILKADGSVANVLSSAIIIRNSKGNAYRIIGSMHDMSKQKILEERLEQEIKLKEKQIAAATEEAKETERSDIGKELHDNVNQLLGVSTLYLNIAKLGGKDSEMYLSRSSEFTLTAIEEIRKLTKGLTTDTIKNLGLCEAIDNITRDTMEVNPIKISSALDIFIENRVNDKFKLNFFRIVQEQLNNILKHAKATEVKISLSQNKKSITLIISDNGVGFDTDKKPKGIGIANIKSRAATYNGTADFVSQPGQGCVLNVTFPVTNLLLSKKLNDNRNSIIKRSDRKTENQSQYKYGS
ncbi:MAG: PAS domain S-box protein [Chitinophagaceae bacterium]